MLSLFYSKTRKKQTKQREKELERTISRLKDKKKTLMKLKIHTLRVKGPNPKSKKQMVQRRRKEYQMFREAKLQTECNKPT